MDWSWLIGRMSLEYLPKEPVTLAAAVGMPLMVLSAAALLTYFKKWRWLWGWLTSLDAKKIGIMYIVVSILMLVRGLGDALMLRTQTAVGASQHGPFSTDTFQQVFTAHGTIMIFFVAMGLMVGLFNIAVPLMIGARDVAFPWLNSVGFWLFVAGMILNNFALIFGGFSNGGWLGYPPLTELQYNPGPGVDYWIWSLQIAGVGSLLTAINFLVTILKKRAPGMTLMKMPIFVWSVLVTCVLMLLAFPLLTVTLTLLALDRTLDMHFFTSMAGGNPMMYINLIWAWGHPEVYILVMPAFGVYSEVVATFARKALFGYRTMVAALVAIMFFSFLVWQHHFFTMGAGGNVNAVFGIATMIIAIPTSVKIFNWLFTMYRGRIKFATPMWWFICFVLTFTIGGVTGVLLAVPAIDFQAHNTLFLVAHFHNTIIGGVVFGYIAALVYWWPKMFGFRLHDGLGKISAYIWQVGFLLTFMPLYALGFLGAPRRIDHYTDPQWHPFFVVSAIGVVTIILGTIALVAQIGYSTWKRKKFRDTTGDPWDARTLEWSVASPAPEYNFAILPTVTHRDEWWHRKKTGITLPPKSAYHDIAMPKPSSLGLIIGILSGLIGFAVIWHMWWLLVFAFVGLIVAIIVRTFDDDSEYTIPAEQLYAADRKLRV